MSPSVDPVAVRRNVWTLSLENTWHPTIDWYRQGVTALQQVTDLSEPRAWIHLANIHGTSIARSSWPSWLGDHGWNACQHGSWYFLSWHRVYLHHFERLVRAEIVRLGGPRDWALPYWDYNPRRPQSLQIPPAFLDPGSSAHPNALYVAARRTSMNAGNPMDAWAASTAGWADRFTSNSTAIPSFGGPRTGWSHQGQVVGDLENQPHGSVHMQVGGSNPPGLMSSFDTAARDPIFWLHHANIDRLWERWRGVVSHDTPTESGWLDEVFEFGHGPALTKLKARDVLDTRAGPLRYRYLGTPPAGGLGPRLLSLTGPRMREPTPQLVGASGTKISLAGTQPARVRVQLDHPMAKAGFAPTRGLAAESPKVYLALENVQASQVGTSGYEVHLGIPDGADPQAYPDRRVGQFSTFGVVEASRVDDDQSGGGRTYSFDITPIVPRLEAAGDWDPDHLRVSITPLLHADDEPASGDVTVGRVGLYYG